MRKVSQCTSIILLVIYMQYMYTFIDMTPRYGCRFHFDRRLWSAYGVRQPLEVAPTCADPDSPARGGHLIRVYATHRTTHRATHDNRPPTLYARSAGARARYNSPFLVSIKEGHFSPGGPWRLVRRFLPSLSLVPYSGPIMGSIEHMADSSRALPGSRS